MNEDNKKETPPSSTGGKPDEAKPAIDQRFSGMEVIVGPAWDVMHPIAGWVHFTFSHPRHGLMNFLLPVLAAKALAEKLQMEIQKQPSGLSVPPPSKPGQVH